MKQIKHLLCALGMLALTLLITPNAKSDEASKPGFVHIVVHDGTASIGTKCWILERSGVPVWSEGALSWSPTNELAVAISGSIRVAYWVKNTNNTIAEKVRELGLADPGICTFENGKGLYQQ